MKKINLENGQNLLRFDRGADDFYFSDGSSLYAVDALTDMSAGDMLWLWGPCGCGKSHLLRGFFRDFKALSPENGCALLSAAVLHDELMAAMCTGTVASLAEKYAHLRLLVVEDMEALAGREAMQNVFMQLFERCLAAGCSVVLSGTEHPERYGELYALLMGCGGMAVELSYPDADCRKNYAVATCVECGVYITLDEAEALAELFSSVPQLRGALFSRALKAA